MVSTIKRFLAVNMVSQADLARGIDRSSAFVSQLVNGETGASKETIDSILSFLSARLGRPVTYEELFGPSTAAALVGSGPGAA